MTYEEALAYLYDRINYERVADRDRRYEFRLQRTVELFQNLGLEAYLHCATPNGATKRPLVHIAGTKGKGSTATMVSAILAAAGHKVGLYTSPHLTELEERFRIDGIPCSAETLARLVNRVQPVVDRMDAEPAGKVSFFELTTAMAILHFDQESCDAIVLEVGLGGRLDSTNVCAASIAIITSIGLDHQRVLGETHEEIAAEKAGIIKSAAPVVCGVRHNKAGEPSSRAQAVIQSVAESASAGFYQIGKAFEASDIGGAEQGIRFVYSASPGPLGSLNTPRLEVEVNLDGSHQAENAALAITACRLLNDQLADRSRCDSFRVAKNALFGATRAIPLKRTEPTRRRHGPQSRFNRRALRNDSVTA